MDFYFLLWVNSAVWFAISTVVNKYYWKYTGFKDEMYLFLKYVIHRKNKESTSARINKLDSRKERNSKNINLISKNTYEERLNNPGRQVKS